MAWRLLEGVPTEETRLLLSIARRRTFTRGEVVFHEGDPADSFHLVARGRFASRLSSPLGDPAILAIMGAGDTFGELALVGEAVPRSSTVSALEASETRAVYGADFARLRRQHPSVDSVLVEVLAARVRHLSLRVVEAYYSDADTRVYRRLHELALIYASEGATGATTIPLTQEEIAGMAGTSRATVNRVLRKGEERGALALARGRVIIHDVEAFAPRRR